MFEPSAVEANTSVTVTLTIELAAGTNEIVVPVPDAFTIFGCTAPAGWTCWTTDLGAQPASMTVARNGGEGQTVAVAMELRTPTAGGDYAFGEDVLVVTGGFEGGPTTEEVPGDDPVVGTVQMPLRRAEPAGSADDSEVAPAILAALVLLVVAIAAYRAVRRDHS